MIKVDCEEHGDNVEGIPIGRFAYSCKACFNSVMAKHSKRTDFQNAVALSNSVKSGTRISVGISDLIGGNSHDNTRRGDGKNPSTPGGDEQEQECNDLSAMP